MVFMALISVLSFVLSMSAFSALHTFTLLAQANTCSLVISLVFLTVVNFHMSSVIITLSLMPFIHFSFSLSCISIYLHSVVFIMRWPIHSSAFSLCSLIRSQYYKDNGVSFSCGLKIHSELQTAPCWFYIFLVLCHLVFAKTAALLYPPS